MRRTEILLKKDKKGNGLSCERESAVEAGKKPNVQRKFKYQFRN